jgi:hypothetical protein
LDLLLLKRQAGTEKINRNKIQEISGAPLTDCCSCAISFRGRGWMQKKAL